MNTPEKITELEENEIFVFGSNSLGKHFGGAARVAFDKFGAEWGIGEGRTGKCYAIPTLILPTTESGEPVKVDKDDLQQSISTFVYYAWNHPELTFYVTKLGTGIAGWKLEEIAPMFSGVKYIRNIILPKEFEN